MSAIAVQTIGFVATGIFILSYQVKSNRRLYLLQLIGNLLFCIQFFLLDARSGCLSLAVNIIRNAMLMKYNDWEWVRWKGWPYLFSGLIGAVVWGTWNGPLSLLVLAASVSTTFGYWSNNARAIRLANALCASPCWLCYDVAVGSWGGVLNESFMIVSILVSILRFGWKSLGSDGDFGK